jgi:uridine phosphorylase
MNDIKASELTLDSNGKVYHLAVGPEDITTSIIFVGDPNRVDLVGSLFDTISFSTHHREFKTITGTYKGKSFTVVSHGIGCDNIDIVLNELDACFNIDLKKREIKPHKTSLNIVRIGTCGALQANIEPGSHVISKYAIGLDGVANFYKFDFKADEQAMKLKFEKEVDWPNDLVLPYFVSSSETLNSKLADLGEQGITITANGFYGPQGRALRIPLKHPDFKDKLRAFTYNNARAANFEMETSALLSLSRAMGHSATTICLVLANRYSGKFESDYNIKMKQLIINVLDRLI